VDENGDIVDGAEDPELGEELMIQLYTNMVQLNVRETLHVRPKETRRYS
jgi:hypothetical protein